MVIYYLSDPGWVSANQILGHTMLKKNLPVILSLPLSLASASSVATELLDTLTVTESRLTNVTKQAANITVIDGETLQNSAGLTLPDILAQQVGVSTTSLFSHGSRASLGIRNFGDTSTQNTLILLDCRRLNDIDLSSVNYAAIPIDNIDRVEIIRGSGAVLYGDSATTGVINIITKNPKQASTSAKLKLKTGSYDHEEANAQLNFVNEHFGITANLNTTRNDGYRDHNDYEQQNGQIDIRVPINNTELYLKAGAFNQEIELPGVRQVDYDNNINQLVSVRRDATSLNDWSEEETEFATIGFTNKVNTNVNVVLDAGYREKQQFSQFDYGFGFGDYSDTKLKTFSITPRVNVKNTVFNLPIDASIGVDLYRYEYDSKRSNFEQNIGQPIHQIDVTQKSIALYANTVTELSSNTFLTIGARSQRVKQDAKDSFDPTAPGAAFGSEAADFSTSDRENSFEFGLKHLLNDQWSIYGRYGRSARFGTVDELFELDNTFQQVFSRLKPQLAKGIEFGLGYQSSSLNANLSFFRQNIDNEIAFDANSFQNINLDKTKHKGLEFSAEYAVNSKFDVGFNYTYLNAEFIEGVNDGNQLTLIPNHQYTVLLSARLPTDMNATVAWNYISNSYFANDASNSFGRKIPAYQTVDLKLSKTIKQLELALAINNIFDESYYNYGVNSTSANRFNAYPLPERNASLSVAYTFD
jgi:iron complex outermembrane receptor protein